MTEESQSWIRVELPDNWEDFPDDERDDWAYYSMHTVVCPICNLEQEVYGWEDSCANCDWMPPQYEKMLNRMNADVDAYLHMQKVEAIERQYWNDPGKAQLEREQLEYERRWDSSDE